MLKNYEVKYHDWTTGFRESVEQTNNRVYHHPFACEAIDWLQVDLLASGASLFGHESADCERRSREKSYEIRRRTFLKV